MHGNLQQDTHQIQGSEQIYPFQVFPGNCSSLWW
jgi:hypothetical protein